MMMKKTVLVASAFLVASVLTGCGTTSDIRKQGSAGATAAVTGEAVAAKSAAVDFAKYDTVVVLDFDNKVMPANETMGKSFSDKIALSIANTGAFQNVERSMTEGKAILIDGDITRYEEGNPTMRLLIGFGAGSSYFDALVNLKDAETGEKIGDIMVDKNSWALGGGIAASQDVNAHMQSAAETIAENLANAKQGKKLDTAQADF